MQQNSFQYRNKPYTMNKTPTATFWNIFLCFSFLFCQQSMSKTCQGFKTTGDFVTREVGSEALRPCWGFTNIAQELWRWWMCSMAWGQDRHCIFYTSLDCKFPEQNLYFPSCCIKIRITWCESSRTWAFCDLTIRVANKGTKLYGYLAYFPTVDSGYCAQS